MQTVHNWREEPVDTTHTQYRVLLFVLKQKKVSTITSVTNKRLCDRYILYLQKKKNPDITKQDNTSGQEVFLLNNTTVHFKKMTKKNKSKTPNDPAHPSPLSEILQQNDNKKKNNIYSLALVIKKYPGQVMGKNCRTRRRRWRRRRELTRLTRGQDANRSQLGIHD